MKEKTTILINNKMQRLSQHKNIQKKVTIQEKEALRYQGG
jgi:hypothetical protein